MPAGPHIHVDPRPCAPRRRLEHAFSVVEVVVAMLILSVVVSAGVVAVASSDRAETQSKTVADMHSIAERAFERAQGDLSERSRCDTPGNGKGTQGAGWLTAAANATKSNSAAAASFGACEISYTDFKDEQGRQYVVTMSIRPTDDAKDGTGSADADHNLRDDYKVSTQVALTDASKVGVENIAPITVDGSVDWTATSTDLASVRIYACGINRPDRSLTVGGCATMDATRAPLGGLGVQLAPAPSNGGAVQWNTAKTQTISTNGNGVGDATAVVEPGAYAINAPATFTDTSGAKWTRFRIDPSGLQVSGSSRYDINVTYVRETNRTINFCTQISTAPFALDGVTTDDGFEAYSTNLNYRGKGSPGFRSVRIDARRDRGWACSKVVAQPGTTNPAQPWLLKDPYSYANQDPFIGEYDLEIEQNYGAYRNTNKWGMSVSGVSVDCSSGLAWNKPLNGTPVPSRAVDAQNDRPLVAGEDAPWYGRYNLSDTGSHRICIRLAAKTLDRDRCTGAKDPHGNYKKGAPLAVPANAATTGKCFYVKTVCTQYCPDGARVCVAHCNANPPGSVSAIKLSGQAAKPFGGPGDDTVGCRPRAQGGYAWYGWKPSVILEGKVGQQATRAKFSKYEWVGGGSYYYNNYSGHHGSGPVYYCENIVFAASSQYLCEQGSNKPVYTGNGFNGCRYHYGDCIQAALPQYPGTYVRGIMRDISVHYDKPIIPSIGALRALTIVNGIDKPETIVGWSPGTWWDSLNLNIRVVNGDPSCGQGSDPDDPPWPQYKWMDPVYVDIWHRIVDEPQLLSPASRAAAGNVGSDRVAI